MNEERYNQLHTMPYEEYIQTSEWQAQRKQALDNAQECCQICNATESLDVHHRTDERRGNEMLANLTVLCRTCHGLFHSHMALERSPEMKIALLADYLYEHGEHILHHPYVIHGVSLGFHDIDECLNELPEGSLTLIIGRSQVGKLQRSAG